MYNDYLNYAVIEPYNVGEDSFNCLAITTSYLRGFGLVLRVQPLWWSEDKERYAFNWDADEEVIGLQVVGHQMKRFSQKSFDDIHSKIKGAKEIISTLWNQRNFEGIKELLSLLIK